MHENSIPFSITQSLAVTYRQQRSHNLGTAMVKLFHCLTKLHLNFYNLNFIKLANHHIGTLDII
jgi:hypothetical protein